MPDFFEHKAKREQESRNSEAPDIVVTRTEGSVSEDELAAYTVSTATPAMAVKVPTVSVAQEALGKLTAFTAAATALEALSHMSIASTVAEKEERGEEEEMMMTMKLYSSLQQQ